MSGPKRHNRSTYVYHGCRCDVCVEASRAYSRKRAQAARQPAKPAYIACGSPENTDRWLILPTEELALRIPADFIEAWRNGSTSAVPPAPRGAAAVDGAGDSGAVRAVRGSAAPRSDTDD